MNTQLIRCAGVPEHFNFPWRLVVDQNPFLDEGVELQWKDDPSGTGSLTKSLANNQVDIAILLTDGALKNYHTSNYKILSFYTDSPIVWGVHAGAQSPLNSTKLHNPVFGISRYTSGSHLMAYLYALKSRIQLSENSFKVLHSLKGAEEALPKDDNLLFLWEKFTTKPWVDNGTFKRIDDCPTPWPAFVIAVRKQVLNESLNLILRIVRLVQRQAQFVKNSSQNIEQIAKFYKLKPEDVRQWIEEVQWTSKIHCEENTILETAKILKELELINELPKLDELLVKLPQENIV